MYLSNTEEAYYLIADYLNFGVVETWLSIPNFDKYEASTLGRIRSKKSERPLKFWLQNTDYPQVKINGGDGFKNQTVHVLVAMAFRDHVPNGYKIIVDHLNGIRWDNRPSNFQLITQKENINRIKRARTTEVKSRY